MLKRQVTLPEGEMSLRELFDCLEAQLPLHRSIGYCASGLTLLRGGYPMNVRLVMNREETKGAP